MLERIILLCALAIAGCSAIITKKNVSSALKNGTGAAYWYQPPPYFGAPAPPPFYPAPSAPLPPPSFYPPPPVYGPPQPPPVPQPAQASFALVNGVGSPPFGPFAQPVPLPFPATGASFDGPEVGILPPGEGPIPPPPPPGIPLGATRQFCRYTATLDSYACNYCCKIAARHYSTSIETTDKPKRTTPRYTGPTIPTVAPDGAPPDPVPGPVPGPVPRMGPFAPGPVDGPLIPPQLPPLLPVLPVPRLTPQCFCCAPKKFFGWI
ncbi:unnamed protein product [Gongylonema pulchrum]|uniref:Vegetative cell wall protein gp1-like n=1 Tax=Gongylonema pulchrum TaxID=637853 RepID=A0A183CYK1_9BILA|nr:unnamed protein product [Gongylonema pulchrum]